MLGLVLYSVDVYKKISIQLTMLYMYMYFQFPMDLFKDNIADVIESEEHGLSLKVSISNGLYPSGSSGIYKNLLFQELLIFHNDILITIQSRQL